MPIEWIGFLVFAASMIGTPGPANMVVMASGARYGARASLPFLGGVILGKQLIIWPLGLGLLTTLDPEGPVFLALKWASVAYILWLAWQIAGTRIVAAEAGTSPPRFAQGLIVHPLNPKAWAMVIGGFTNFVHAGASALMATLSIALALIFVQTIIQPLWMLAGVQIAKFVTGTPREPMLMRAMAILMVGSVLYVLLKGG
jgi:threonine/homoserine/homoserine lactone efflux protein